MEKWWLLREDFSNLVTRIWNETTNASSHIQNWQNKIRKLRRITKGGRSNEEAQLRRYKKILLEDFDKLNINSETSNLSDT